MKVRYLKRLIYYVEMKVMGIALDTRTGSPIVVFTTKKTDALFLYGLVLQKLVLLFVKLKIYL